MRELPQLQSASAFPRPSPRYSASRGLWRQQSRARAASPQSEVGSTLLLGRGGAPL